MDLMLMIGLPAFCAGLVQGVTGFGAGIVMMMVFPYLFSVIQGAALAGAIGNILCVSMMIRYRKYIRFKEIIWPTLLFSVVSTIAIDFSTSVNQELMKLVLGVFLSVLSLYFLFFAKNKTIEVTPVVAFVFIFLSGLFNGLFGIGGPLMVIYFLSRLNSKEEYLGTIQTFFLLVGGYATFYRIQSQIITTEHLPYIGLGMIGVLVGLTIANRIVDRIDGAMVRKLTYILIGLSGLYNIIAVLIL